jgi:hypothetical protein
MGSQIRKELFTTHLLHAGFLLDCFSTLKMEIMPSSETSVLTRATWQNIPKDGILHGRRRKNPKILQSINWLGSVAETYCVSCEV